MKCSMKTLIKIILAFTLVSCAFAKKAPLQTVDYVDLDRYLGKWYEIARFDQKFQRGCTATTAEYSKMRNGDIKVVNSCRLNSPDGKLKSGIARAWVKDKKTNAKLKVQFFLRSIRLGIFAGNYWIIDLDKENYQYAMVGDPSRKYLWILNRNPQMENALYYELLQKAEDMGFDTSKLLVTEH